MTITPELEVEWFARDLIRQIQELRKEADFNLADRIQLSVNGGELTKKIIAQHTEMLQDETLSTISEITTPDIEKDVEMGGEVVKVKLKRTTK